MTTERTERDFSRARRGSLAGLFDLAGKVALITGGSRGLGLQIAEALGEFGATTILVARKEAELMAAVGHLKGLGVAAVPIACDLGSETAAKALIDEIAEQHGRLDILVNNAGSTWGAPMESYPIEAWNKVINLNVTGLFLLTQAVGPRHFLPQGSGKVLNVASVEGLLGHHPRMTGTIAYNTAKGAVINLTRALAAEWGSRNINVNALAPGYFPSKMTATTIDEHGVFLTEHTPLGRLGGSEDLKGAALLLASEAGRHINGQVLVVDGGASII
jgi:NAD(P)-dependent dehydrogenase (short-subunit alcohol dehydrogenase family)